MTQRFHYSRYSETNICQVCDKPAAFYCSNCKAAYYCSPQHQKQDWPTHKIECKKIVNNTSKMEPEKQSIVKIRRQVRKRLLQRYSAQKYHESLIQAKILQQEQLKNFRKTKSIIDEFEYAATVCILIKIFINLGQANLAKHKIQQFLKNNKIMNETDIFTKKTESIIKPQDFITKKLNLISNFASFMHALHLPCIQLYFLYAQNIQLLCGESSVELSNCYFLIGCYYAQQGYPIKSLACFKRCSQIRMHQSGDCYFNMGIILKWLGKYNKAIQLFQLALLSRNEQFGKLSDQVAEIKENLALIYMDEFDFKTAISLLEQAYQIRSSETNNPNYQKLVSLIITLYKKLDAYIMSGTILIQKVQIYTHLKQTIKDNVKWHANLKQQLNQIYYKQVLTQITLEWNQEFIMKRDKLKFKINPNQFIKIPIAEKYLKTKPEQIVIEEDKQAQNKQNIKFEKFQLNIALQFLSSLDASEAFFLSKLQMQLEHSITAYNAQMVCLKSELFQRLNDQKIRIIQITNPHIFVRVRKQPQKLDQKKSKKIPKVPKLDYSKSRY